MNLKAPTKQNETTPIALEEGFVRNDALNERNGIFNQPQSFLARNGKILLRRRKFALGVIIVGMFYATALLANFLAPYDYRTQVRTEPLAPPSSIRFRDSSGKWS
nr:hypothetical protein [Pyrinomonadaceae bacterium]